jgi:hypothetical protein
MNKSVLNILIDALTEEEWSQIKLKVEARMAFQRAASIRERQESAIQFGDWILKHNVTQTYVEGALCWTIEHLPVPENFTTLELYKIYVTGEWEEDLSDWDVTLNDGLDD